MKTFSILEALQAIEKTMPINLSILHSIEYAKNNKYTFLLAFNEGTKYIVNLDEKTFIKL